MRSLRRNERLASVGVVLGLLGMVCLLAVSLAMSLSYKRQAEADHALAAQTEQTLQHLRTVIYERCLQRQKYDLSNHNAVLANEELYRALLDIARQSPMPPDTDARTLALYQRQTAALQRAHAKASSAARVGVIGTCTAYQ